MPAGHALLRPVLGLAGDGTPAALNPSLASFAFLPFLPFPMFKDPRVLSDEQEHDPVGRSWFWYANLVSREEDFASGQQMRASLCIGSLLGRWDEDQVPGRPERAAP